MGLLDVSYYGWEDISSIPATFGPGANIEMFSMIVDNTGSVYVCGIERSGTVSSAVVYKSKNQAKTWETVEWDPTGGGTSDIYRDIAINSSGTIYVVGIRQTAGKDTWIVKRSQTGDSGSFEEIDTGTSFESSSLGDEALAISIDNQDNIYVAGRIFTPGGGGNKAAIRKSTTGLSGSFVTIDLYKVPNGAIFYGIVAKTEGSNVYACGTENSGAATSDRWLIRGSVDGSSGSFSTLDSYDTPFTSGDTVDIAQDIFINSSGEVFAVGTESVGVGTTRASLVRKSNDGSSGSFFTVDNLSRINASTPEVGPNGIVEVGFTTNRLTHSSVMDLNDGIYYVGRISSGASPTRHDRLLNRSSVDGSSGSWSYIDGPGGGIFGNVNSATKDNPSYAGLVIAVDNNNINKLGNPIIYLGGIKQPGVNNIWGNFIRRGQLTANSASIGEKTFATSIGGVKSYLSSSGFFSGSAFIEEFFKLANVSEFPHSSGIFQMKNLVLGTTDTGKIGNTDDSIVQVKYFGSVVNIMWPKQGDQAIPVRGFGDFSAGQRAGKLTTQFEPGEIIDVREFDHMALWCYLRKEVSGTLDDIEIKIERRPLRDTGFTTDQVIEYSTSGSFSTVATLTDLIYRKSINYGDLSIREIGYPIDLPLLNTREVRVQARHVNGQTEENKNLVVWGRLIKSKEET